MKNAICLIMLLTMLMTPTLPGYGQGEKKPRTLESYTPRTLQQLSELLPASFASEPSTKDAAIIVHADLLPTRVKVTYAGEKRPLNERKKTVIVSWANRFAGAPEFYTAPYDAEMLFTENGENYWLVQRKEFVTQFERELKKGDTIELCLIKMGNIRIDDKLEPVILVEKFLKP